MNRYFLFITLSCFAIAVCAQMDSAKYTRDFKMNEGIYLDYTAFRNNLPISKYAIQSKEDKDQLEFLSKLISHNSSINFLVNKKELSVIKDSLWGYCQNNTIYIYYSGNFCRIPVFGNLSHFIAVVDVVRNTNYATTATTPGNFNGPPIAPMQVKTRETRQFIFDFYSGEFYDYDLENLKELLSRDQKLFVEFNALKRRKQKKMMGIYLKRYNDANPISFPVYK